VVAIKGGEVLVDAMVAKLRNGLGARIDTINAEYDDGIDLKTPGAGDYYTSGLSSILSAPAVIVAEGPMEPASDLEGPHSITTATMLGVYVMEQDTDRQRLGKRLQRLARAVIEVAWDDQPPEQLVAVNGPRPGQTCAYQLMVAGTQPGRVFDPDQDDSWRGFYLITFQATQLEE
jgi:hypothetical protein